MRKLFYFFITATLISLITFVSVLSILGIETKRFNSLISQKINDSNKNINLILKTVKFKLDINEISLFLETTDPQIEYRNVLIPANSIKVYMDFLSILKTDPKIKKVTLELNRIKINQLKNISLIFKPSNFKSFLNNKVKEGTLNTEVEIYFDRNNSIKDFIGRGKASNFTASINKDLIINDANFTFIFDKSDILVKNIVFKSGPIVIKNGDLKLNFSKEIALETSFELTSNFDSKTSNNINFLSSFKHIKNIKNLKADLKNSIKINLDKTYKIIDYSLLSSGKISESSFLNNESFKKIFLLDNFDKLMISNTEVKLNLKPNENNIIAKGKYSLDEVNFLDFSLNNKLKNLTQKFNITADYDELLNLDIINYSKKHKKIAKIELDFTKKKDDIFINEVNFTREKDSISIKGLKLKQNKFLSLQEVSVQTHNNNIENNNFSILYNDKIIIKGSKFDATNLTKVLKRDNKRNFLSNVTKNIEIDFSTINVPLSEKISNFKLIGNIERGKFSKISAKGSFGENKFIDIQMRDDKKNNKKYLEIYSDLTKPLLTEYSFFNGLSGGNILFSSAFAGDYSKSNLKIENFKVINAPGMVKLLSLADLGGLADLAEGEGLSFDSLEIKMEKTKNSMKFNEILALGPSISVLMEGYQNKSITSLRGTLVPAKTLNKFISKIPVIGDIVIPKEVGEGLFGVSFKIKGPPGKVKTTINPIRTLTPRFIQKIAERNKQSK